MAEPARAPDDPPVPRADDVRAVWEMFVTTGTLPPASPLRPEVADSWRRSRQGGVDPDHAEPDVVLGADELAARRAASPLAVALPVVRDLLVDAVAPDGLVVALSDDAGRLLWVEGDARVRRDLGAVGFEEGAVWREDAVGTNAPGTALQTGRPVRVVGPEHFTRPVQQYSCAAVPVHDLASGAVIGVLDVTGGEPAAAGVMLSLVRASAAAVERELARVGAGTDGPAPDPGTTRLAVLGHRAALRHPPAPPVALGLRHAEILLLLAQHPLGLTPAELAVLLSSDELSEVTVRAEVSRLRRVAGDLVGGSRPYRLARAVRTDVDVVREHLARGDVAGALARYPGPVLPRSVAPAVEQVRAELAAEVRAAVLRSDDAEALQRWLASPDGAGDRTGWVRLVALSTPQSPRWVRARARVALLDHDLASPR